MDAVKELEAFLEWLRYSAISLTIALMCEEPYRCKRIPDCMLLIISQALHLQAVG